MLPPGLANGLVDGLSTLESFVPMDICEHYAFRGPKVLGK